MPWVVRSSCHPLCCDSKRSQCKQHDNAIGKENIAPMPAKNAKGKKAKGKQAADADIGDVNALKTNTTCGQPHNFSRLEMCESKELTPEHLAKWDGVDDGAVLPWEDHMVLQKDGEIMQHYSQRGRNRRYCKGVGNSAMLQKRWWQEDIPVGINVAMGQAMHSSGQAIAHIKKGMGNALVLQRGGQWKSIAKRQERIATQQAIVQYSIAKNWVAGPERKSDPDTDSLDANGRLWTAYNDDQRNLLTKTKRKIAKKEMYFKSSTIDFIAQGIPQTASETLMENSDKRSLFTDRSAGSVGKYYAIVSAMVIRRNPPSLHRKRIDTDQDGWTSDDTWTDMEEYGRLDGRLMTIICGLESGGKGDYNHRERRAPTAHVAKSIAKKRWVMCLSCKEAGGGWVLQMGRQSCGIANKGWVMHSSCKEAGGKGIARGQEIAWYCKQAGMRFSCKEPGGRVLQETGNRVVLQTGGGMGSRKVQLQVVLQSSASLMPLAAHRLQ
ncbi:hypothetical protein L210DRAFT_3499213 [Boletus edulis BED1]|uniref:Uncharacterized protein n=1 Tax=Boletus edulis BED1 TaxID=1328754 RepID=A0AAD4GLY5_BOLED|nr:hypothetical protein L210DRAFT_3499213 [Boletus edulis BED1]